MLWTRAIPKLAFALSICSLPSVAAATITYLNGGASKNVLAVFGDDQSASTLFYALVPGAERLVNVPAGGDTVIVTFAAECRFDSTGDPPNDGWLEIEIRDNNVPIPPTGNDRAFCSAGTPASNSVQVVKRLAPGAHAIRVFFKRRRLHPSLTETGSIDDWALTIEQFE